MKYKRRDNIVEAYQVDHATIVPTMEGSVVASSGDYVVTDHTGAKYIIPETRFNNLFEKVGVEDDYQE